MYEYSTIVSHLCPLRLSCIHTKYFFLRINTKLLQHIYCIVIHPKYCSFILPSESLHRISMIVVIVKTSRYVTSALSIWSCSCRYSIWKIIRTVKVVVQCLCLCIMAGRTGCCVELTTKWVLPISIGYKTYNKSNNK